MAIARLHGGPLDGQLLPLDDSELDRLIVPYSETQVVYERKGDLEKTGENDGPTEAEFWFVESEDDIDPNPDGRDD
ncbi:MAG: response regulator [Microbacterium pygmaeum]